jgi:cell division septal protein FtsQ
VAAPSAASARRDFAVRRESARRRGSRLRRLLPLGILVVAVAGGLVWLDRSGAFAIARVETGTYRFTDAGALEMRLGTLLGRRLWRVGADEVMAVLDDLPWIRSVGVRRRLPATLRLELTEWRPLLAVAGEEAAVQPRVLLEDGRIVAFPDHLPAPALPVLVGAGAATDSLGALRLAPERRAEVLALLAACASSGLETVCPVDFLVARDGGFAIVLQDGEGTLLVGREDYAARLDRYLVARDHLEKGLEVDLRFGDRVTVRRPGS